MEREVGGHKGSEDYTLDSDCSSDCLPDSEPFLTQGALQFSPELHRGRLRYFRVVLQDWLQMLVLLLCELFYCP